MLGLSCSKGVAQQQEKTQEGAERGEVDFVLTFEASLNLHIVAHMALN